MPQIKEILFKLFRRVDIELAILHSRFVVISSWHSLHEFDYKIPVSPGCVSFKRDGQIQDQLELCTPYFIYEVTTKIRKFGPQHWNNFLHQGDSCNALPVQTVTSLHYKRLGQPLLRGDTCLSSSC